MNCIYSINVNGRLLTIERPLVMGIVNVTPDSFYGVSRVEAGGELLARCRRMLADGADIIDIGACSTRPGSEPVGEAEELKRLHAAFEQLNAEFPDAVFSVDTFRARVARECVKEHAVAIINDVSGFDADAAMLDTVAELNVPYVLTHSRGAAGDTPNYTDFIPEVFKQLADKMWHLRQRGVNDVIIDPGFGFGKTLEQNYTMLDLLEEFSMLDAPLLVGVSRKSMITKTLGVTPEEALNGTSVLNTIALMKGAHILRVHDVKPAVEAVKLVAQLKS
jgi:dihydropteroate synthase